MKKLGRDNQCERKLALLRRVLINLMEAAQSLNNAVLDVAEVIEDVQNK